LLYKTFFSPNNFSLGSRKTGVGIRNFSSIWIFLFCAFSFYLIAPVHREEQSITADRQSQNAHDSSKVIHADRIGGAQALQKAIQACYGTASCVVDARNPSMGVQNFSVNPFASPHNLNMPITIYTGAYTVQWDVSGDDAVTVDLPSDLKWILKGTTIEPSSPNTAIPASAFLKDSAGRNANDGGSGQGMMNARVYGIDGTISAGSRILTVSDAKNLRVGMAIAIVGGAGGMAGQETMLDGAITSAATQLTVATATGFPQAGSSNSTLADYNYVMVDREIICWRGINGNTLQNLVRGQFGATAANHSDKARVSALGTLVTEITGINNIAVTLLDKSVLTLTNTQVQAGASNISIQGNGTISGNYIDRTATPVGSVAVGGVLCYVCSSMSIGENILFSNLQHTGVFIAGGRHNVISGHYRRIGRPSASGGGLGADIFLFGNACRNIIRSSTHQDGNYMVLVDDRSADFNRLSGASNENDVRVGRQEGPEKYTSGVGIEGYSSRNKVTVGRISVTGTASNAGLYVAATSQWPSAIPNPTGNHFTFKAISSVGAAIKTANYFSKDSSNLFVGGVILKGSSSLASQSDRIIQRKSIQTKSGRCAR
jgi:hypothetical protein